MKTVRFLFVIGVTLALILSACAPAPTATVAPALAPTQAPVVAATTAPTAAPAGLTCAQPIKIGLITDLSGALASYGEMIVRS
jgi:ABC-type branched-subunit amino acid transport system substrate-binding protein